MALYFAKPATIYQLIAQRVTVAEDYIRVAGNIITHFMKAHKKLDGFDLQSARLGYHIDKATGKAKAGTLYDDYSIKLNQIHCPNARQAYIMVRECERMKEEKDKLKSILNGIPLLTGNSKLKFAWLRHPIWMNKIAQIWNSIQAAHEYFEDTFWKLKQATQAKAKPESQ
ncbi:MAG: hypothetical protein OXU45_01460 [Candidatus Melainabacteria bacterium]|nr:hypothetical protein [Candidatus Melainabacteria bacterium]